jgi:hypothetical protein
MEAEMLARVATFNSMPEGVDPSAVDLLRTTIRETPGFVAGFHLGAPGQKALSIVVFEDHAAADAARTALSERSGDSHVGIEPDAVEFFEARPF